MTSWLRCSQRAGLILALLPAIAGAGPSDGGRLYILHCSSCHGEKGQGSNLAPSLIGKSASDIHLMLDTGRMPAAAPGLNEIHRAPVFTYAQINSIVRYVQTFSPHPDTSLPLVMPGNAVHGRALFAADCAVCHGATGEGSSVGSDDVAPSLGDATVFQVAEAIRAGPGVMPHFGPSQLSDRDVDDIARYVNTVQTQPADLGGFSLGHVGPVAEGFVGWLFGIGVLTLFVRRIGTTK